MNSLFERFIIGSVIVGFCMILAILLATMSSFIDKLIKFIVHHNVIMTCSDFVFGILSIVVLCVIVGWVCEY